jgi:hypothetical protein
MFPEASATSVVNVTKGFQFQHSHIFIGEGSFPIPRPPERKSPAEAGLSISLGRSIVFWSTPQTTVMMMPAEYRLQTEECEKQAAVVRDSSIRSAFVFACSGTLLHVATLKVRESDGFRGVEKNRKIETNGTAGTGAQ